MTDSMKALIFHDKGNVTLEHIPIPECPDEGVIIKVARAGICGSDISSYTKGGMYGGVWLPDAQFGHEFVGVICAVGKNAGSEFKEGMRVWGNPDYAHEDPKKSCMAGGFAEYVSIHKAILGTSIFELPDSVPFSEAVLIEPFGVGVHCKNRGGVKPGDKVLMYGAGPIGMMGWAAMKYQGVEKILVCERMPSRIEFARKLGADVYNNSEGPEAQDAYAREFFGVSTINSYDRADVDVVLDYVGLGSLINEYMTYGRCRSVYATLGLDQTPTTINPGEFMSKEYTVTGSRSYTPKDIAEVIEVLEKCSISIGTVVTSEFSLEDVNEAFETALDKERGMKVVFNISD